MLEWLTSSVPTTLSLTLRPWFTIANLSQLMNQNQVIYSGVGVSFRVFKYSHVVKQSSSPDIFSSSRIGFCTCKCLFLIQPSSSTLTTVILPFLCEFDYHKHIICMGPDVVIVVSIFFPGHFIHFFLGSFILLNVLGIPSFWMAD